MTRFTSQDTNVIEWVEGLDAPTARAELLARLDQLEALHAFNAVHAERITAERLAVERKLAELATRKD